MANKVWRIFHFTQRYELPEDVKICRKSGLLYVKLFVGISAGDEAVGYEQQMQMCCNGDGQQSAMIEGLYSKLVKMAGKHSYYRRGYLIDAAGEPLTVSGLAKILNFPPATMKKWIRRFEDVRLLERVDLPEFDKLKGGDIEIPENQPKNEDNSGADRNIPEKTGKKRKIPKPFKKTTRTPSGVKTKEKRKATNGKTAAVGCKEKDNGNSASYASALEANLTVYPQSEEPIADKPNDSDLGGVVNCECRASPPGAVDWKIPNYDQSDIAYGRRIYLALGFNGALEGERAVREITSFASVWHDCRQGLSGLPPPEIDRLGIRGLAEAKRIARYCDRRKGRSNRAAIWNDLMVKISKSIFHWTQSALIPDQTGQSQNLHLR